MKDKKFMNATEKDSELESATKDASATNGAATGFIALSDDILVKVTGGQYEPHELTIDEQIAEVQQYIADLTYALDNNPLAAKHGDLWRQALEHWQAELERLQQSK